MVVMLQAYTFRMPKLDLRGKEEMEKGGKSHKDDHPWSEEIN